MTMAVLEVLRYPHPVLKKPCGKVAEINGEIKKLIEDMRETMYHCNGIGLAACQVGVSRRIIVTDVSPIDPEKGFFAVINPEIISEEGEVESEEGCLSVPECTEKLKRKEKVCVRGVTPEGEEIEVRGDGILAIALQHEVDHINGVLILDRMSRLKREIYRNKLKKERRKEERE